MVEPAVDVGRALSFLGSRLEVGASIGPMTTYRVGGSARWFVEVIDQRELRRIARAVVESSDATSSPPPPILVVGRGSNLLVADHGFDGLAVRLGESFATVDVDDTTVRAGAAASLPVVARRTVAAGLTGFEWAVGVPGSIGGAVRMNAGGHGADMAASLRSIRFVDVDSGEDGEMSVDELDLGYRASSVRAAQVVTEATLSLAPGSVETGQVELSEIVQWRREHQPGGQNAGSVFANPPDDSAGRLIDAAGCRGLRVGSVHVSTKHANFFQADAGGSADDVFALMVEVARRVRDRFGIDLRPETRMIGFGDFADAVGSGDTEVST